MSRLSTLGLDENRPKTNVRLTISANHLMDLDVFSKSDPICFIYEKIKGRKSASQEVTTPTWQDEQWTERGRTEIIWNNLNPQFKTTFVLPYFFEETQLFRFELYDADSPKIGTDLTGHDFLGRFECVLAQIVSYSTLRAHLGTKGQVGSQWRNKDSETKYGSITIRAEEEGKNQIIQFDVRGEDLDKKDFFGKSDPYLNFKRTFEDGSSHLIHQTEVKPKTLNPRWAPVTISVQAICGNNLESPIIIECFDHEKLKKSDDFIGTAQTTLSTMLAGGILTIPLINDKKLARKPKKYKSSGRLIIWNAQLIIEPTFLDFISGGTQLDFAVAVDFTASNGNPTSPGSLHYLSSSAPNQYEIALRAVLNICQHYNHSKTFEAYGFGAKLPNQYDVSEVFPLDVMSGSSQVVGINGVMTAYRNALCNVQLYGPTNFAPIIRLVGEKANKLIQSSSRYKILLIITDGIISDMYQTVNTVISASGLPLSIIIIGVGDEDFEKMHELDSDDALLQQNSRIAQRDIVQFVKMRDFLGTSSQFDSDRIMANLAREVLYEVPEQLTSYMKQRKFLPRSKSDPWPRDSLPEDYQPEMDRLHISPVRASAPPST